MATVEVTESNFDSIVKQGIVLLDFWASWCGPCRVFAPIFETAAEAHPGVVFGKVDTDAQPALAAAFEVKAIPTLAVLRDGVLLGVQAGVVPARALEDLIQKVRSIDMQEVQRQLARDKVQEKSPDKSPEEPPGHAHPAPAPK